MAIKLGQLIIELTAKSDAFAKGMTDMRDLTFTSTQGMVSSLEKVGVTISKLKFENSAQLKRSFDIVAEAAAGMAISIGSGVVGALALVTEKSIDAGAKFFELSQKTGVGVEALSSFSYAAKQSGLDADTMAKGLERLSKNALQAAQGGASPAAVAFKTLGIAVTDSGGKLRPVEDLMLDIAEKFSAMENGSTKTALAMNIFGRAGAELIPLLNRGRDGLKEMTSEAARLGEVMSADTAQKSHELEEAMGRVRAGIEGAGLQITSGLIPALLQLTNAFTGSITTLSTWQTIGSTVGEGLKFVALMANTAAEGAARLAKAQAEIQQFNPLLRAIPGMGDYLKGRSVYFDSLIEQAKTASDRINGITQNGPGGKPLGSGGAGAPPDVAIKAAKESLGQFNSALAEMQRIAQAAAREGLDPIAAATAKLHDQLQAVANALNKANESTDDWRLRQIAAREAAQASGVALKGFNQELDKIADENRIKALTELKEKFKDVVKEISLVTNGPTPAVGFNLGAYQPAALSAGVIERQFRAIQEVDQLKRAYDELAIRQGGFLGGAQAFFRQYADAAKQTGEQIYSALSRVFSQLEDTLAQFIVTGKADFKSLLTSIETEIARIAIRKLIIAPIINALGLGGRDGSSPNSALYVTVTNAGFGAPGVPGTGGSTADPNSPSGIFGKLTESLKGVWEKISGIFETVIKSIGSVLSSIGNAIAGIFGGGRASGGWTDFGKIYKVNETGTELFAPGRAGGTVIPLGNGAAAMQPTVINFTVHAADANSFRLSQHQITQTMLSLLQRGGQRR